MADNTLNDDEKRRLKSLAIMAEIKKSHQKAWDNLPWYLKLKTKSLQWLYKVERQVFMPACSHLFNGI